MFELVRPFRYLWLPLLFLVGFLYGTPLLHQLPSHWMQLLPWIPLLLATLILLLAWRFHSHRAAIVATLIIVIQQWLFSEQASDPILKHHLLALVPLNLSVLVFLRDRSLLTAPALILFVGILFQVSAIFLLQQFQPQLLQSWLLWQPASLDLLPFQLPYPFTVILVQLLATLVVFFNWLKEQSQFNSFLLVTLIASIWVVFAPLKNAEALLLINLVLFLWLVLLFSHSHDLAYLDDLTGLPGRRALNQRLQSLGRRHCIAMTDIDHFKRFNDTYGHDVGDQVLRLVASKLRQVRMGTAYRYGGEEFCIVFAGKRVEQIEAELESLRETIAEVKMQLRSEQRPEDNQQGKKMRGKAGAKPKTVSVTISIGVAQRQAKLDTIKEADKALYKAKAKGRNCVVKA